MDPPTIDILTARVDRVEREQALLLGRVSMLETEKRLEYERRDHFYAFATWAVSRLTGGPFTMVERMLIGRIEKLWAQRRQPGAVLANSFHWPPDQPPDDDDPGPAV